MFGSFTHEFSELAKFFHFTRYSICGKPNCEFIWKTSEWCRSVQKNSNSLRFHLHFRMIRWCLPPRILRWMALPWMEKLNAFTKNNKIDMITYAQWFFIFGNCCRTIAIFGQDPRLIVIIGIVAFPLHQIFDLKKITHKFDSFANSNSTFLITLLLLTRVPQISSTSHSEVLFADVSFDFFIFFGILMKIFIEFVFFCTAKASNHLFRRSNGTDRYSKADDQHKCKQHIANSR